VVAVFTILKPRGKPFERGKTKTGGRKTGARNLYSRAVRWIIAEAAHQVGGLDRLVSWIKESDEHETLFWTQVWPRLLPHASMPGASIEVGLDLKINPEDLVRELAEAGLPTVIFGADKPVLELTAVESGNGPVGPKPEKGNGSGGNGHDPSGSQP